VKRRKTISERKSDEWKFQSEQVKGKQYGKSIVKKAIQILTREE